MTPNTFLDENLTGFGEMHAASLENLQKALTAGDGVDASGFTGGRALIPESLEKTLVNVLHSQDEAVLFKALKKTPIKGPVHQWNYRDEVGADDGAWVPEGGDSEDTDQDIQRKYMTAKYLQTRRQVTLQAASSNMLENAMAIEQNAGMLWLIRNAEKGLVYGNSTHNQYEPDGLIAQIPSTHVIDMRGGNATSSEFEDKMNESCRQIRDYFGKASLMLTSTMVMQDVQELLRDRIRFEAGNTQGNSVFTDYPTPFGTPTLKEDVFIKEGLTPSASSLSAKRLDAPTLGTESTPASDTGYSFGAADAGEYVYKVVAVNRYGDSVASSELVVTGVADGDMVQFTITKPTGTPTAYKIYRSKKDAGTGAEVRYMETIVYTGAAQVYKDDNTELPGCSDAFILTMDKVYDAIEWFQFLPAMKFDLYPTNAAVYPFLMLLFGGLALKKPVQHIRIKNIAPKSLDWFS
jgi:hypothetical protein